MEKLSVFLYRISHGWIALAGLLLFIGFSVLALPGQSRIAQTYSQGKGSPDTSLFYSASDLYEMAGLYGEQGRQAYLNARWTFDLAFPLIYTFFFITSISWLLDHILPLGSKWRLLNLVPVSAFILDLLENTATSLVMARYPLHCPPGEFFAPLLTPMKWLTVVASMLIVVISLVYYLVVTARRKTIT